MNEERAANQRSNVIAAIAVLLASLAYWFTRTKTTSILPIIAADLDGMSYYTWSTMMFMLTSAITAPLWGKLADLFGKKKILSILLCILVAGDVVSAFAPNIFVFITGFAICGIGAGGMQGTYFALLAELFDPEKRGKYGGYIMVLYSLTAILMPIISAAITQMLSWRYVFYMTIFIYAIAFITVIILIPKDKKSDKKPKIDFIGLLLIACAVVPFLLALSWGGSAYPWNSPTIILMLIAAAIFFVLTYIYEKKNAEYAIVSIRLLQNRNFIFVCLVSFFSAGSMTAVGTFLPLFVQGVQGISATIYSTYTMPANIVGIFVGASAGWLMDKTKRYKWLLVLAPSSFLVINVIFGVMPATTPAAFIIAVLIARNICGASYMPSINPLAALAQIDPSDFGAGTGTLNFVSSLGNAVAPALLGSVLNGSYAGAITANTASIASQLNPAQIKTISNARILINAASMNQLKGTFGTNSALFNQTVAAVKNSLQSAVSTAFIVAACITVVSVIAAVMVKEIPLDQIKNRKKS